MTMDILEDKPSHKLFKGVCGKASKQVSKVRGRRSYCVNTLCRQTINLYPFSLFVTFRGQNLNSALYRQCGSTKAKFVISVQTGIHTLVSVKLTLSEFLSTLKFFVNSSAMFYFINNFFKTL